MDTCGIQKEMLGDAGKHEEEGTGKVRNVSLHPRRAQLGGIATEMGAGTAPRKCQIPTGISAFSQLPPLKHFLPSAEGDVRRIQPRNPDVYASS